MKFIFTKHAKERLRDFARYGVKISRQEVIEVIKNPEHVDEESDHPKMIASKPKDAKHILRVVFKIEDDIITVITFYPAMKGRYYENQTTS